MKRIALVVGLVMCVATQPAWAARTQVHEAAESPQYGRKFGGMIGRGIINGATFFMDPLVNIVNESRNGPPLVGTLVGVGKGLGCGALRLLSGAVDLTTFWVPGFNGFPVSDSYDNCLIVSDTTAMAQPAGSYPSGYPADAASMPETSAPAPAQERPHYSK